MLIYVLLAAALVTAMLQHWVDTAVIVGVVVVNALIGFVQEGKAEGALDALPSATPDEPDAQPQEMAATGTDDQTPDSRCERRGEQLNGKTCENRPEVASGGETPKEPRSGERSYNASMHV